MTDEVDSELTRANFIVFINSRRARNGFQRTLTEEEYIELYERCGRLPP